MKRIHNKSVPSTQLLARDAAELLTPNEWYAFTADEQTMGQGTKSRTWISPPDVNIYVTYTILLDMSNGPWLAYIPHIVALTVSETFERFGFTPTIKWPNDLLLGGKKACGILSQAFMRDIGGGKKLQLLVGIGVNVNMPQDLCDSLEQPVSSMLVASGKKFDKEVVLKELSQNFDRIVTAFIDGKNFSVYSSDVSRRMEKFGGNLMPFDQKDDGTEDGIIYGSVLGLTSEGLLRLSVEGKERDFVSGRFLRGKEPG